MRLGCLKNGLVDRATPRVHNKTDKRKFVPADFSNSGSGGIKAFMTVKPEKKKGDKVLGVVRAMLYLLKAAFHRKLHLREHLCLF